MDSYIVRIYRRDIGNRANAAGQVEIIQKEQVVSFTCVRELLGILDLQEQDGAPKRQQPKRTSAARHAHKQKRKTS